MPVCLHYLTLNSFVQIICLSQPSWSQGMQVLLVLILNCHQQQSNHHRLGNFVTFIPNDLPGILMVHNLYKCNCITWKPSILLFINNKGLPTFIFNFSYLLSIYFFVSHFFFFISDLDKQHSSWLEKLSVELRNSSPPPFFQCSLCPRVHPTCESGCIHEEPRALFSIPACVFNSSADEALMDVWPYFPG